MPWVEFVKDMKNWPLSPLSHVDYVAGTKCLVSQECASFAIERGYAKQVVNEEEKAKARKRK